jgi:hypothetical protein
MAAPKKPKSPAVRAGKTKTIETAKKVRAAEMIRVRAYEIFLGRNGNSGDEVSDWLAAERELLEKL